MLRLRLHSLLLGLALALGACPEPSQRGGAAAVDAPTEHPVRLLPLGGPIADASLEISGMAWRGDHLILLPERLGLDEKDRRLVPGAQRVYVLTRQEILDVVDGRAPGPLVPRAVPVTPDIADRLPGCDGFEAIAFVGDQAFVQIETYQREDGQNPSILLRGHLAPDLSSLSLELDAARAYARQTKDPNTSHEAIFAWKGELFSIFELNDKARVPRPAAQRFDTAMNHLGEVPFPHLDYRVTDVTDPDEDGYFWAINYRFPGSGKASPEAEQETLCARFGIGATHQRFDQVERLVELQVTPTGIRLTDRPPVMLELPKAWQEGGARNWEGLARLSDRGFLLVTDKHPKPYTQFAFVPFDFSAPR